MWKKKGDEERFDVARKGDTLFAPFQCDFCWFVNLKGRLCQEQRIEDRLCVGIIRRVNLDMFWAREASTVNGMFRVYEQARKASEILGIQTSVHVHRKPWPLGDKVGFGDAMVILWQSLQGGKNCEKYQQFESIRKIRSLANTIHHSRGRESVDGLGFREGNKLNTLAKSSTGSVLFTRFMKGCEKRMGRVVKQDVALSLDILKKAMSNLDYELTQTDHKDARRREIIMLGGFLLIGFCDALRGNEVFLVERSSLCKYGLRGINHRRPHVMIPLMGRFKGETGERNVMRVLVERTASGLEIKKWVARLINLLMDEQTSKAEAVGPAFCDRQGEVLAYQFMNNLFHEELIKIQEAHPELLPPEVEVADTYNLFRSLRRGATSRASALNYSETLINLNNRWRLTQNNKGKGGLKKMSQLYVDVSLVLDASLEFSALL